MESTYLPPGKGVARIHGLPPFGVQTCDLWEVSNVRQLKTSQAYYLAGETSPAFVLILQDNELKWKQVGSLNYKVSSPSLSARD